SQRQNQIKTPTTQTFQQVPQNPPFQFTFSTTSTPYLSSINSMPTSSKPTLARTCSVSPCHFSYAYEIFQQSDKPEIHFWNSCLKAFAESNSPSNTIQLFVHLLEYNVLPDHFTCSFVLEACTSCSDISFAKMVHGFVEKMGFKFNDFFQNMLLHFDVEGAYDLFCRMPERIMRSWASMISGGQKRQLLVFLEMEEVGVRPNEVTIVVVLASCANLSALEIGSRVHEHSNQSGYAYGNFLVGYVDGACNAWASQGSFEALALFDIMKKEDVEPNEVTFVGLLRAFSHIGMVNEGRRLFESMSRDYRIVPRIEHHGCMVDLLSRAGHLEEAHDFIKDMPLKLNGVVWGALLGGCKVHKNIKMAEKAISCLRELDPLNDGLCVLSNIYAEAGWWEDVARVRKLMRDDGVKKTTGWSLISIPDRFMNLLLEIKTILRLK
ncbi:Pentatricopeptide repeat, partial [Dillenia turbinata]